MCLITASQAYNSNNNYANLPSHKQVGVYSYKTYNFYKPYKFYKSYNLDKPNETRHHPHHPHPRQPSPTP